MDVERALNKRAPSKLLLLENTHKEVFDHTGWTLATVAQKITNGRRY